MSEAISPGDLVFVAIEPSGGHEHLEALYSEKRPLLVLNTDAWGDSSGHRFVTVVDGKATRYIPYNLLKKCSKISEG